VGSLRLKCAAFAFLFCGSSVLWAQEPDPRQRLRSVRELARTGEDGIPKLSYYTTDGDLQVKLEAVKALVSIGGPKTLDGLVRAARENDAEVQIRATDGLVNVYLPGYIKNGLSGSISRVGNQVRAKFNPGDDRMIDPFVEVRPDVIAALGKLVRGGASVETRANAARAVGVLRGNGALPDLYEALRSKDDTLMLESLDAIEKIGDPSAAPRIVFLLRDLDDRIQSQALRINGMFRNRDAAPQIREAVNDARSNVVKRAAVTALAQLALSADHPVFLANLSDKDEEVRAGAVEGLGRLANPVDRMAIDQFFNSARSMNGRLAAAFALVNLGDVSTERYSPLKYLVNTLNQKNSKGTASAYLVELARKDQTRAALHEATSTATKDEKIEIAGILARVAARDSLPTLEALSNDPEPDVAREGIRQLRALRAQVR